jgi:hypothetical protein
MPVVCLSEMAGGWQYPGRHPVNFAMSIGGKIITTQEQREKGGLVKACGHKVCVGVSSHKHSVGTDRR